MAKNSATHPAPAPSSASQPVDSRPALAPVIEINVRHIGRTPQPEKLTGSEAPEGWIKKIDRPREGKVKSRSFAIMWRSSTQEVMISPTSPRRFEIKLSNCVLWTRNFG
jgi:hypothetical protein